MKRVTFFLVPFFAVAMAGSIWAQQKIGTKHMKTDRGLHKMMGMGQMSDSMCPMMDVGHMQGFFLNQAEALGLNDSQIAQLRKIKTTTQKEVIKKEADLRIAQLELNELMRDSKTNRSALEAKAKKVEELRMDIRLTEFKAQLDARAVLTPEQLKKAKSMKMHRMRGEKMQMGSQGKDEGCPMMGSNSKSNDGTSEHEKHHPKNE